MGNDQKEQIEENQLEFYLVEQQISVDERWKYVEKIWEAFKFYITILSSGAGLIIAVFSLGSLQVNPGELIFATTCVVFTIGALVYAQIISLGRDLYRANRRLTLARDELGKLTRTATYIKNLRSAGMDLGDDKKKKWPILFYIKKSFRSIGLQTQIVFINSAIGTIGVITGFNLLGNLKVFGSVILGSICFIMMVGIHIGYYALARERATI